MTKCREEVWDYNNGFVICIDTGEVIDRIYDYSNYRFDTEEAHNRVEVLKVKGGYSRKYHDYLALERRAKRLTKGKPWLRVNYVKLYEQGKFIKTITSLRSASAVDRVINGGIHEVLDKIIKIIEDIEPAALARTERAKYALAYIVYLKTLGKCIDLLKLVEMFNISQTTIKRLEKIADRVYSKVSILLLLGKSMF